MLPGDGAGAFGASIPIPDLYVDGIADVTGDGMSDLIGITGDGIRPDGAPSNRFAVLVGDGAGGFTLFKGEPAFDSERVASGDFDGDGLLDVLSADGAFGNSLVHLSNGDGTFGSGQQHVTGSLPSGVAIADLTGDGKRDIITSNQADHTISVLPGLGNGAFGPRADYSVGAGPRGLALGDLNGDGLIDVVTADEGPNGVSVLLGMAGGLAPAVSHPGHARPVAVALADMDRDGHPDAVVVDQGVPDVAILRGDGAGGLALSSSFATSANPLALAIGDFDADGWPDVAVMSGNYNQGSFVDVFRDDNAGGLLPEVRYGPVASLTARGIAIGDVTSDGIPDIVAGSRNFACVLKGQGNGAFTVLSNPGTRVSQMRELKLVDMEGDGKLDIVAAADYTSCAWILRGHGDGTWEDEEGFGADRGPSSLAVADLDMDGALDIVVANGDTNLVSVLLANPSGAVPALATLVSAEATPSGVRLAWQAAEPGIEVRVERSEGSAPWARVGQTTSDASGRLEFEDHDVRSGAGYAYRLFIERDGQEVYFGFVSVQVPVEASLALVGSRSNPARGVFEVSFSLPDAGSARLELFDVAGRRLVSREVGSMGPGAHVLRLDESSRLPAGLYWLRLVRPDRVLVSRAALVH